MDEILGRMKELARLLEYSLHHERLGQQAVTDTETLINKIELLKSDHRDMEAWGKEQLALAIARGNQIAALVDTISQIYSATDDADSRRRCGEALVKIGRTRLLE